MTSSHTQYSTDNSEKGSSLLTKHERHSHKRYVRFSSTCDISLTKKLPSVTENVLCSCNDVLVNVQWRQQEVLQSATTAAGGDTWRQLARSSLGQRRRQRQARWRLSRRGVAVVSGNEQCAAAAAVRAGQQHAGAAAAQHERAAGGGAAPSAGPAPAAVLENIQVSTSLTLTQAAAHAQWPT